MGYHTSPYSFPDISPIPSPQTLWTRIQTDHGNLVSRGPLGSNPGPSSVQAPGLVVEVIYTSVCTRVRISSVVDEGCV